MGIPIYNEDPDPQYLTYAAKLSEFFRKCEIPFIAQEVLKESNHFLEAGELIESFAQKCASIGFYSLAEKFFSRAVYPYSCAGDLEKVGRLGKKIMEMHNMEDSPKRIEFTKFMNLEKDFQQIINFFDGLICITPTRDADNSHIRIQ
ncbi:MAG: hypothetical protein ACOYT4_00515 [Nanoarchaeota archaeon]